MVRLYRKYEDREYMESYSSYFEDAMADKLKDLLGADYYKNVYIPFKNKIASKVKVGEDEDGNPIMGENPDLKLKRPDYLLKTYSNNPQELKDLIDNYKTKRAITTQKKVDGAEKIGENDEYTCYRITKYPAAQYYGSNTTWCITGRYKGEEERGEYYFNKYIRDENLDGGYYFFIHKTNPRRKYALLQKKDKTIHSIWSALNSPLTLDRVPVFPLVKEIPELKDVYEDVDIENPEHLKDRDRKSLEHDILISCELPKENAKDAIRNLKEILEGDAYKDYKFDLDNIKDDDGNTPLYLACFNNNTELSKLLLEHGAGVNVKNKDGNIPLYWACANNNTELIKLLLEQGANVNIKNKDGYTPLYLACISNNIELVKLLLDHGAEVNSENKEEETPLSLACRWDNIELAKLFIEHGADVNSKNKYGDTPLLWASSNDNTELIKLLLEQGAEVDSENKEGETSLYNACNNNNTELAKLFIEYGANVNIKNNGGRTPLSLACYKNNTELAKLLIDHGADVNSKDEDRNEPLYWACYKDNVKLVKLLLEHGAEVNNKNKYEETPLYRAYVDNNTEVEKLLVEHGADVNIKDENGNTPLSKACVWKNIDLVKLLLEHGADVNSKDKFGTTPLFVACRRDNIDLVKLLLDHGAGKDLDANNLPEYITNNKEIEDLVISYLNKNKNESIRFRRLYRL